MKITIHQPEHLPWIGYFHKMAQADVYVFLDNVQFRKNYFQNRNRILTPQGPAWLAVPVKLQGHMTSNLRAIEIAGPAHWNVKYWRTLQQSYQKHPYFAQHVAALEPIICQDRAHLVDLNYALIEYFARQLGVSTRFVRASELDVTGASSQLLLQICQRLGATTYLSGPSGRDYLDVDLFSASGIEVEFHAFTHPVYPQRGQTEFVSHLAALDLLANVGPAASRLVRGEG